MTLDEAIKHAEEVAEVNARQYKNCTMRYESNSCGDRTAGKCAEEHRQLAEWLREFKAYREKEQDNLVNDSEV